RPQHRQPQRACPSADCTSPSASAEACRGTRHRPGRCQASGAACESAPIGSVKLGLSLGGVGKLISVPRPKVTAAERQVPACAPSYSDAGTRTTIAAHQNVGGWVRDNYTVQD